MNHISVIIPTYNRAYCLKRALNSVIAQSLAPNEIIVIDDGGTDDTKALTASYGKAIRYVYQPNQGVSCARNAGIINASHPWIAFLDSDDAWQPTKLEQQMNALNHSDQQICHTEELWIRNGIRVNPMRKHQKSGGDIFKHCLPMCAISPSSVIIHRDIFDEIGLFDESLPACEDYDLWLRICAKHSVLFIEEPLTIKYGGHPDQLSQKYWGMDRFRIQALEKILNSNSLTEENRKAATEILIKKIRIYLNGAIKRGKKDEIIYYQNLLNHHTQCR